MSSETDGVRDGLLSVAASLDAIAEAIERLANAIQREPESKNPTLSEVTDRVAYQIKNLGNADATTQMGALEALGKVFLDGLERIAEAIEARNEE